VLEGFETQSLLHNFFHYSEREWRLCGRSRHHEWHRMRWKLETLAYCFKTYFELIIDARRYYTGRTNLLAKRIVRSAVLGAIIAASVIFAIALSTSGNGEVWSLLSEQQFQTSYPELDYVSVYLAPSISKLAVQAAIWGSIIGAAFSLVRWAFSSDK